ncbi:hypothetical protein [Ferrimicrobium acidiphilum]|uniref:hypothetical protein n=1 Tax=Ferrimicrobium acidiphilum TaxID=121039 RepID=UPI0023EF8BF5|nr:hypothetical protein [Ferrimicrobium acidiphilum]MCL5053126.1 hypothetical protein [Gammaproteobacteria bacterium]
MGLTGQRRLRQIASLALLPLIALLASCGSPGATPIAKPVVQNKTPGKLLATKFPTIKLASAVTINWGNSPNLNLQGAKLITRFGVTYITELVGAKSQLFVRTTPKSSWDNLGNLPGDVVQLDFPSPNDGFALAETNGPGSVLDLYSTSDAGRSWKPVTSASFIQVHFFNSRDGIALFGASSNANGVPSLSISSTTDSGKTWNSASSLPVESYGYLIPRYVSFSFGSPDSGYLAIGSEPGAGSQSKILFRTDNRGQTWREVSKSPSQYSPSALPMNGYLEQISFTSATTGYLVDARGPRGALYFTSDGGVHWSVMQILSASASPSTSLAYFRSTTPFVAVALTNIGSLWNQLRPGSPWVDLYPPYWVEKLSINRGTLAAVSRGGRALEIPVASGDPMAATKTPASTLLDFQLFDATKIAVSNRAIWTQVRSQAWERAPLPRGDQALFADFATPSTGIVAAIPNRNSILSTTDGGRRWERVSVPFMPLSPDVLSANDWWMIGGTVGSPVNNPYKKNVRVMTYYLYHTTNAGRSWTRYSSSLWSQISPYGVKFFDSSVGYLWTSNRLFLTTDGGRNFVARNLPSWLNISSGHGLAPGGNGKAWIADGSYPLLATSNFGASFDVASSKS